MDDTEWTRWLTEPFRGRKVILGYRLVAASNHQIETLRTFGAQRPLLVSIGRGTGPVPPPDTHDLVEVAGPRPPTMTEEVRQNTALASDPPPEVRAAVESYDPDGEAIWWLTPYASNADCLGRPVLGGRPASWAALEDKTLDADLWREAGVAHSPSRSVRPEAADLRAAADALDTGAGTVWSGDARDGLNGGSDYVRWVRTPEQAADAETFFAANCDRVRVMPYLEGPSCSIHGFVLPDGVAALRPVEQVQIPDAGEGRFASTGMSTWWDPAPEVRNAMREAARAVGRVLDRRVGYRGGFSIDGIVTAEGFRPTELNPRFSGGLGQLARAVPSLPIELVQLNAVRGRDIRLSAADLEHRIVGAADEQRSGRLMSIADSAAAPTESVDHRIGWDGVRLGPVDGSATETVVRTGPSMIGGRLAMWELDEHVIARGQSALPHARALRRFATSDA
ncbi:hypothetical protein MU582_13095 [Nocardioidaceae bacterium SCSIO 66511]|nr:hypothetical protein MU582_13095 [Nocardioidaceae bacterium SCSIO 66511]